MFKGTDNGYELDKTLTRAEMCALISRILVNEKDIAVDINYTDVDNDFWAYTDIAKLTANGIINGIDDNSLQTQQRSYCRTTRRHAHKSCRLLDIYPKLRCMV